jgi:hypothetical protein
MQKGFSLCIINSSGHSLQAKRNKTEFPHEVREYYNNIKLSILCNRVTVSESSILFHIDNLTFFQTKKKKNQLEHYLGEID